MLIRSLAQFKEITRTAPKLVIADVETKGLTPSIENLLGIAMGWNGAEGPIFFYVPLRKWDGEKLINYQTEDLIPEIRSFLRSKELIGHNIEYDRKWIDILGFKSAWHCDTRLLWYLLDERQIERGFGLKTAQLKLLKWESTNEDVLDIVVKSKGGSLKKGHHYLAPVDVLGAYAALDAKSTVELYELLWPQLVEKDYVHFYRWSHSYQRLLAKCTEQGVDVDLQMLKEGYSKLKVDIANLTLEIYKLTEEAISSINKDHLKEEISRFKTGRGLANFMSQPHRQKRFNFRSNHQKARLFYEHLGLPILERTETGLPKVDKGTIAQLDHPVASKFVELAEKEKLSSMIKSYIECIEESNDGKIHFPYNICGTVSGRLGGFKPYALNLPFDAEEAMRPFTPRPGFEGIHSDLRSIEPCFIAAYSKDPTILKVHRDNLGDVYLDLALVTFPDNQDLKAQYNPYQPVSEDIKKKFKALRNVCKIIHLAVGYTGTSKTVSRALTRAGFPTTEGQAADLVESYWNLFSAVKDFNSRCQQLISKKGYLINPFGRRLYVPAAFRKDTMNRLVQSSAHDALIAWVKEIKREMAKRIPEAVPLLPDCHDSTSWQIPLGTFEVAKQVFENALRTVSDRLGLCVTLSCETKRFSTLYGLKNDEGK